MTNREIWCIILLLETAQGVLFIKNSEEFFMFETLKAMLVDELQLNPEDITPESALANDLGINSIELADLVMLCEERFNVEFEDDDIHKLITIGDVVAYLEAHNAK